MRADMHILRSVFSPCYPYAFSDRLSKKNQKPVKHLWSCFCCNFSLNQPISFPYFHRHANLMLYPPPPWSLRDFQTSILVQQIKISPSAVNVSCSSFTMWWDTTYQSRHIAFSLFTYCYVFWCSDMNSSYSTFYYHKLFEVQIEQCHLIRTISTIKLYNLTFLKNLFILQHHIFTYILNHRSRKCKQ